MFIHFQLQWSSGLGATRHDIMTLLHLATGSPSGFLRIVEPFSLAEWHDIWMPWDAHGATWQMVKWCDMTPKTYICYTIYATVC